VGRRVSRPAVPGATGPRRPPGPRPAGLSPSLTGDPVALGSEVLTAADLGRALGLPGGAPRLAPLAPGLVLAHALSADSGHVTLRAFRLPHAPLLTPATGPVDAVLALTAPVADAGRAVQVAARLRACLADPAVRDGVRRAATRQGLVQALAPVEATAGEGRLAAELVLALLDSTAAGLTPAEAGRRRAVAGPNRLERVRRRPLAARLLEQFWSFFAILLWIGGGLAVLAGMPELGWAICLVIVVNGIFGFLQEYRAERAVEALQELLPTRITVVRAGMEAPVSTADLVPGDVVRLAEGSQVPADGVLLDAVDLRVDQSALTGESHPVEKRPWRGGDDAPIPSLERPERLFAGTGVMSGAGTFVVTATGMATEIGAIAHLTQTVPEEPSPLQREMAGVTRTVTALAVAFGVGFFWLGVATGTLTPEQGLVFALGVIVANVPEGLLPTLTLALALGVQRMASQRSLLKRLSAVETLGATTVICTDKTGTLTEGRMAARWVWAAGRAVDLSAPGGPAPEAREVLDAAVLASQAGLDHGDPTEIALVRAGAAGGIDPETRRAACPVLATYPFDSIRKRMTLVRRTADGPVAYVKGAPRETLALCTTARWGGPTLPLTEERRGAILADHDRLAAQGLRLLAVAVRPLGVPVRGAQPDAPTRESPWWGGLGGSGTRRSRPRSVEEAPGAASAAAVERDLVFLGLVALWDPPRAEVPEAVALCRRAGIRVVVVTGDYGLTAQAIAREIGLAVEKVVSGEELDRLVPDALSALAEQPGVLFARTSPAHKLAIVRALKARGEVVAVTGDGVNDAPALKGADIGIAMGRRGSDVAKEAAVMVITDDNFASIVTAVRQGRAIYANVGKFITYIFASNVPELVPFLAAVFLGIPLPLTVMQILAVDLGTDLLPALALGAEPPEPGVMDRPPRPRAERLLGARRLLHAYGFLGVAEAALALAAYFWTYWLAGWRPGRPMAAAGALYRRATTMTLAGIVAAQVGNVLACRTERESVFRRGLAGNPAVVFGMAAEIGILVVLIGVPPLARVFGLEPPGVAEWAPLLGFPAVMVGLEEARKWIVRHRPGREEGTR
jgi:Ca2+-transporting ATPase